VGTGLCPVRMGRDSRPRLSRNEAPQWFWVGKFVSGCGLSRAEMKINPTALAAGDVQGLKPKSDSGCYGVTEVTP
jgi:hypothetical protein